MRTFLFLLSGFLFSGACYLLIKLFIPHYPNAYLWVSRSFAVIWCLIALANMVTGITKAGYGFSEEFPIFLIIFLLPAIALFWLGTK